MQKQLKFIQENQKPHVKKFPPTRPLNVLMIAEKPSVALSISKTFDPKAGNFGAPKSSIPTQNFQHQFFGHKANITCSSVIGHVFNRDFPPRYQGWESTDPETLFTAETLKNEADDHGKVVRHLKQLAKGQDVIVFWLDNDREGENICFEVLDVTYHLLNNNPFRRVYRANFYSLVESEIRNVYNNLENGPDINLSLSVEARQVIDLKVGVAFTRFQSVFLKSKFVELKDKTISYGPCQTPTLGLVVGRDMEIAKFVPKKYYAIEYKAKTDSTNPADCEPFKLTPSGDIQNQFWTREDAQKHRSQIPKQGSVIDIETKSDSIQKPTALNTVALQRFCCKNFNISSKEALDIAESLYLRKYVTYPRTESTTYPKGFNFKAVIKGLTAHSSRELQQWSNELLAAQSYKPNQGVDKGDHPPIVPTENPPSADALYGLDARIYEYICSNFLASISENATYEVRKVKFAFGDFRFTHSQKTLQRPGFMKYKRSTKVDEDFNSSRKFAKGDQVVWAEMAVEEKFTQPPSKMNESTLLKLMEEYGIGTDASMATHIDNIIKREYVKIEGDNRTLVSTPLGMRLVEVYLEIDKELVQPQLRGNMEKRIELISLQKERFELVLNDLLGIFRAKFVNFKAKIGQVEQAIQKDFKTLEQSIAEGGQPMGRCGDCLRYMNFSKTAQVIHCENCKQLLNIGKSTVRCGIHQCPTKRDDKGGKPCNFSEVEYKMTYYIDYDNKHSIFICVCPYCLQNTKGYFSQERVRVGQCGKCPSGQLFLALSKSKKEAFYVCSGCPNKVLVLDNLETVKLDSADKTCAKCKRFTLVGKLKKPDGTKVDLNALCPLCDDKRPTPLIDLTEWKFKAKKFGRGKKKHFGKRGK